MIALDRYEGDFAILEIEGELKKVPRECLVGNIPEGSVLTEKDGKYEADSGQTAFKKQEISDLQDSLFD